MRKLDSPGWGMTRKPTACQATGYDKAHRMCLHWLSSTATATYSRADRAAIFLVEKSRDVGNNRRAAYLLAYTQGLTGRVARGCAASKIGGGRTAQEWTGGVEPCV